MAKADFTKISTQGSTGGSTVLDRVIGYIADAFRRLGDVVANDNLIPVTFSGAAMTPVLGVQVKHGLRTATGGAYAPASWEVVRLDSNATLWESPSDNAADHLVLNASAPCKATVRFN